MPTQVTAKEGQTLCGLAIDAGFLDCKPVRDAPENKGKAFLSREYLKEGEVVTIPDVENKPYNKPTEQTHEFVKKNSPPVSIRFVHGSPNLPYLQDATLNKLAVSNFPADKAGQTGGRAFPSGHEFNAHAHADEDTFKIEIQDPQAGATVSSELEILMPKLDAQGKVVGHEPFKNTSKRKLTVECKKVNSKVCYRSEYFRLVVDDDDFNAISKQALLAADIADGKGGNEDAVEILDQLVRASYEHSTCTKSPKCKTVVEAPVGDNKKRVKVSVHVLQDANGNPVASKQQVRARVLAYVRQLYAQADLSVQILMQREIPLPANLIAVANGRGRRAKGGEKIKVSVRVDKRPAVDAEITTKARALPEETAAALAGALNKALPNDVKARVSTNPRIAGQAIATADVLVGDPSTQNIRISVTTNADPQHRVSIGRMVTPALATEFGGNDSHVGTIDERVLVKNYDTGADRIDLFIISRFPSSLGEAFTPNNDQAARSRPNAEMINTAIVFANTITRANHFHTTIPHEMGHILMDAGHVRSPATEMMGEGSPVGSNERAVGGPKRIAANRRIRYDAGLTGVPVDLIHNRNAGLIDSW